MKQAINVHQRHPYSRRATDLHRASPGRRLSRSPRLPWLGDWGCECSSWGCCSHLCSQRAVGLSWKVPSCQVTKKAATCRLYEYASFPFLFFFFFTVIFCCCFCFIGLTRCSKHLVAACLFFRLFCNMLVTQQRRKEQERLCHIFCPASQMFQHLQSGPLVPSGTLRLAGSWQHAVPWLSSCGPG